MGQPAHCSHCGKPLVVVIETDDTELLAKIDRIEHKLDTVIKKENKIMGGQADIDASVAAVGDMVVDLRDAVVPGIAGAQAKLDEVIADLKTQGVDTSALAEVTAALTEARTGLDSTVAALVADPNIPTDAPVEGGPTADGGGNSPA